MGGCRGVCLAKERRKHAGKGRDRVRAKKKKRNNPGKVLWGGTTPIVEGGKGPEGGEKGRKRWKEFFKGEELFKKGGNDLEGETSRKGGEDPKKQG